MSDDWREKIRDPKRTRYNITHHSDYKDRDTSPQVAFNPLRQKRLKHKGVTKQDLAGSQPNMISPKPVRVDCETAPLTLDVLRERIKKRKAEQDALQNKPSKAPTQDK